MPTSLPVEEQVRLAFERARLTECNDAMARMYGFENAADLADDDLTRHLPLYATGNFEAVKAFFESGYRATAVETLEYDRYGHPRRFSNNVVGIIDNGHMVRVWGSQTDITQRKRYEQSLIDAREQALELARLKSTFLAQMSHEIRTPLTAMIGFADILADEAPEQHRELAGLIRQSGQRLIQTLKSVLDLTRLEGEPLEFAAERFDVVELAQQVLDLFRLQAQQRGLDLTLETPPTPVIVWLDAGALSRILTNLVSNAMKFTPEGQVTVIIEEQEQALEIRVEDTGVGISEDFLPRIFAAFRQEAGGLAPDEEGSGLGLAITERLVALLGGAIDVESKKGQGSVFTVRLPKQPLHETSTERREAE